MRGCRIGSNEARSSTWLAQGACAALALAWLGACIATTGNLLAQDQARTNIYRYTLDVDPPEPAGLVPLDLGPRHVLRATAPKPLAAGLLLTADAPDTITTAVMLEVSPYYLVGGGTRSLQSYRSNSVWGRLHRVLIKTILAAAIAYDPAHTGAARIGVAVRSTFHDPHDPISSEFGIPERVDSALIRAGVVPAPSEEDVSRLGVDLAPIFTRARRDVRARCCVQVSGGWGFAGTASGGRLSADSIGPVRHTVWLSAMWTFDSRFDMLLLLQGTNFFRSAWHQRAGLGVQRKGTQVDLLGELYFDSERSHVYPGLSIEGALGRGVAIDGALTAEGTGTSPDPRLRTTMLIRWYMAHAR